MTEKEKRELALSKIEQFEYGYSSNLEKNIMITLFVDGYNERDRQINDLSLGGVMPSLPNFREIRKAKGLTLRKLEEITGISNAYLSQLENGKIKSPSYNTVKKLYDLYNKA